MSNEAKHLQSLAFELAETVETFGLLLEEFAHTVLYHEAQWPAYPKLRDLHAGTGRAPKLFNRRRTTILEVTVVAELVRSDLPGFVAGSLVALISVGAVFFLTLAL